MSNYTCPNCKNPIYDDEDLLCHFCGESLRKTSSGFLGGMRASPIKWIAALIALIFILSCFFMF